jgi:hypothetical protein
MQGRLLILRRADCSMWFRGSRQADLLDTKDLALKATGGIQRGRKHRQAISRLRKPKVMRLRCSLQ